MKNEIKKSLERLIYWEDLANKTEEAWEADLLNEELEEAFDHYYELEFNEYIHLIHLLTSFTGMNENSAKQIINTKREELRAIIA